MVGSIRFLAVVLGFVVIAGASGGRSDVDAVFVSTGPVSMTDPLAGIYRGVGTFQTPIAVFAPGARAASVSEPCRGDIRVTIDRRAPDAVIGRGVCDFPSGRAPYSIRGDFVDGNRFAGVITFRFSGVDHAVPVRLAVRNGKLLAVFAGDTPQGLGFKVRWNGAFDARRI